MEHELVDALTFAEAHFALGRMHVHIHLFRRQFEEQHEGRMALVVQDVLIGLAHGVREHLVAHEAAIDEEILFVACRARIGGQGGDTVQLQAADLAFYVDGVLGEFGAEEGGYSLPQPLSRKRARGANCGCELPDALAVVLQRERHIRPRQRDALECFLAPGVFGIFSFQEFSPRRGIEIQLAQFDAGALGMGGGCGSALRAVHRFHFPCVCGIRRAAGESDLRHRRHARQCLAAKAHAGDALQVVE